MQSEGVIIKLSFSFIRPPIFGFRLVNYTVCGGFRFFFAWVGTKAQVPCRDLEISPGFNWSWLL